ncbi:hypothetical protein GCM10009602_04770 [Nocardiopsis tropica]
MVSAVRHPRVRVFLLAGLCLLTVAALMVLMVGTPGKGPGTHETTGADLPHALSFTGVAEVEAHLETDRRGPTHELLTTENGVLAVFDEGVALFGTDPVAEIWNRTGLDGPVAAGITADGKRAVLAHAGSGWFRGTRWSLLDVETGENIASHRADEPPPALVASLTADARLASPGDGRVEARSLEGDDVLWSYAPEDACDGAVSRVVGETLAVVAVCGDRVHLVGLEATTGEPVWEHSWPGTVLPEMHPLTPWTVPGGPADPVERIVRGEMADGYVLFGRGAVFDRGQAQEFLPPQAAPGEAPAHVVLLEDLQDADARLMLQAGHVMVEDGLVGLDELDREGLLVDGDLPMSAQEWDGDPRILLGALQAVLADAANET